MSTTTTAELMDKVKTNNRLIRGEFGYYGAQFENYRAIKEETFKQFEDVTYRLRTGIFATENDRTAADVWAELKEAQESTEMDGWAAGFKCMGLVNELVRRGQIAQP